MKRKVLNYVKPGKWEVVIPFDKEGKELEWVGIVDGREPGEYNLTVVSEHTAPHTKCRVTIRAVCGEESVVNLKGIIRIGKEAQVTNDFLELRVLTLGPTSRATASPELEILANNVKASHAASIGRVDAEQVLYLESRGLSKEVAEEQIVLGFLGV
jgi:Fe-S cluster assembly protein SufD